MLVHNHDEGLYFSVEYEDQSDNSLSYNMIGNLNG